MFPALSLIHILLELSYLGYDCLEHFTFLKDYLTPQQVRETCARHGTSMSALYALSLIHILFSRGRTARCN